MVKNVICTECPMGCSVDVEIIDGKIIDVKGNTCPRGKLYAQNEVTCPKRVLTTTVRSVQGALVPVKTDAPVKKELLFSLMEKVNSLTVNLPIATGDIVCKDFCDGVNLVSTATVK